MNDLVYFLVEEYTRVYGKPPGVLVLSDPLYRTLKEQNKLLRGGSYNPGSSALKESFRGMDIKVLPTREIHIGVVDAKVLDPIAELRNNQRP